MANADRPGYRPAGITAAEKAGAVTNAEDHGGASDEPYLVGPGRPPREHMWKPGQSGNPGGRPKGQSVTALMRKLLGPRAQPEEAGAMLAERLLKEALQGKLGQIR